MHLFDDVIIVAMLGMSGPASQAYLGCIAWQLASFDELDHLLELSALVIDFIFA